MYLCIYVCCMHVCMNVCVWMCVCVCVCKYVIMTCLYDKRGADIQRKLFHQFSVAVYITQCGTVATLRLYKRILRTGDSEGMVSHIINLDTRN
jgi:hypothetical protein